MVIGITGLIGSGKSTAAKILKSMGAALIDADKIGRDVVNQNPQLLKRLARQFGRDILTGSGRLNRKKLASLAFENGAARRRLNQIVHPYLLCELKRQLKARKATHRLVVVDAALLLEWNLDRIVDAVIMIHASEKDRLARLSARGIEPADARARQAQQLSYKAQRQRADHVIFNNRSEDWLATRLTAILRRYEGKTG